MIHLGKFRFDLAHRREGAVAGASGALAGMGGIAHQPKVRNGGAVGEPEGAKGARTHPHAADDAARSPGEGLEGFGGGRFGVDQMLGPQVEILAEFGDRLLRILPFEGLVAIARRLLPNLRIREGGGRNRRATIRGAAIAIAADGHK